MPCSVSSFLIAAALEYTRRWEDLLPITASEGSILRHMGPCSGQSSMVGEAYGSRAVSSYVRN